MKKRLLTVPGVLAAGLLTLSACSVPGLSHSSPEKAAAPASTGLPPVSSGASAGLNTDPVAKLEAIKSPNLGSIVTDQNGFTLYRFAKDPIDPPTSNCAQQCASTWPPALVSGSNLGLTGITTSLVGTITRADGSKQLTIGGHPLYRYAMDKAPGETNGQGVGQTWFAVTPSGTQAGEVPTGATLSVAHSETVGTIVTDADGFTLYRFDHDSAHPSASTCTGMCATTWPPAVITSSTVTLSGVDKSAVGSILRPDGTRQLTVGGWPVYEYSKDTAQGDVNGQGVGGVWAAVTPTGAKNPTMLPAGGGSAPAANEAPSSPDSGSAGGSGTGYSSGY
jgi:predicted lipoprotein with Yx(FWY)xxD motif